MRRLVPVFLAVLTACSPDEGWTELPVADAPPPTLFPGIATSNFLPGQAFDVVVSNLPQWSRVQLFATMNGIQTDHGPCAPLGGGCLDLAPQVHQIGFGLANADGEVIFNVGPAPTQAIEVTFQAGAYHPATRTAGLTPTVIQPLQDADLDGVATADDCDDDDPTVSTWMVGYLDEDLDGEAVDGIAIDLCTDGTLPVGYVDVGGSDCDDLDDQSYPGGVEVCDGAADNDCDGVVDNGCPSNDPFNSGSCLGTPWSAADALAYLAGRTRVVLDSATIQERSCPGGVCAGPYDDWDIRYLTWSGGVSTRYRTLTATMDLVLFDDRGTPAMSIQHTSFGLGNYDDDEGMVYGFPPQLIRYPHVRAFNDAATGYDYVDLDYQVEGTSITYGDGCLRWTADPFGAPTTRDWAVRFTW
jgi:hypothetical protein